MVEPIKVVMGNETSASYLKAQVQSSHHILSVSQQHGVSQHELALRPSNILTPTKSLHNRVTEVKPGSLNFMTSEQWWIVTKCKYLSWFFSSLHFSFAKQVRAVLKIQSLILDQGQANILNLEPQWVLKFCSGTETDWWSVMVNHLIGGKKIKQDIKNEQQQDYNQICIHGTILCSALYCCKDTM